jgi:hypothetical protein
MKKAVFLLVILIQLTLLSYKSYSQNAIVEYNAQEEKNAFSGKVIDEKTREPLVGTSLLFKDGCCYKQSRVVYNQ